MGVKLSEDARSTRYGSKSNSRYVLLEASPESSSFLGSWFFRSSPAGRVRPTTEASSVFREADVKAMRTEYEELAQPHPRDSRVVPVRWSGARRNCASRPCTVSGWTRCRRTCRST